MKPKTLTTAIKKGNANMFKRKLILCATEVKRDAVRRESIDGVEHIIVSSSTLPDDIVMNGGLYPADEIEASYLSLERTLAPIEHPTDSSGHFISASDPYAIHNFHAGAFNANARREGGKVLIDKIINVQEAMRTDRGKRLLDRIKELETNEKPRPIHTSVGVFLEVEETDEIKTNARGQEYSWVARNMCFDHDAILLDSIGAATPSQGVGIAVNADGEEITVEAVTVPDMPDVKPASMKSILEQLKFDIKNQTAIDEIEDIDLIGDLVVFETEQGWYQVPYAVDTNSNTAKITGLPIRVERQVVYTPKTNSKSEGEAMKDMIVNALNAAGVQTEGLTDEQLLAAYNGLHANQSTDDAKATDDKSQLAAIVANAIAPLSEKIGELEGKIKQAETAEIDAMVSVIVNSGRYPGLDAESIKLLPAEKVKQMAANSKASYGLPVVNSGMDHDPYATPTDMPA